MPLLGIAILTGITYLGKKLYEYVCDDEPAATSDQLLMSPPARALVRAERQLPEEDPRERQELNRYLSISAAGVGLAVLGTVAYPPATLLSIICILYGTLEVAHIAWQKFVNQHRISFDTITVVAVLSGLATNSIVLCALGECIYFIGAKLRAQVKSQLRQQVISIFNFVPDTVWLVRGTSEVSVPLADLQAGDIISVGAGEIIPVDGIVINGDAAIDQRCLTGEAQPEEKTIGDPVLAGALIISGRVQIQVITAGSQTAAARIESLLNSTTSFERTLELRSEDFADSTVYPTLGLAAVALLISGPLAGLCIMSANFSSIYRLTSPWTMLSYIAQSAQRQLLVKDGRSLELISHIDMVVFDKTGTLTMGDLSVAAVHPLSGISETEILRLAASAEQRQPHIIAAAILQAAESRALELGTITEAHYELGNGVKVRLNGEVVLVGSERFMRQQGIGMPDSSRVIPLSSDAQANSLVYIATGSELIGMLELQPVIRPEAVQTIQRLRERGLSICLLSGDHEAPTRALAAALGIEQYFAETLPEDKARVVEELQAAGRSVCMVGDGINDAVALKKATLSVSLAGASSTAIDSAQIVLLDRDLYSLDGLFELGRSYANTQQAGLAVAVVPGALCMGAVFLFNLGIPMILACYLGSTATAMAIAQFSSVSKQPRA